jgi:transposase
MSGTSESSGRPGLVVDLIAAETGHTGLNQPPAFSSLPISTSAGVGPGCSCRVCDLLRHAKLATRLALFGEDKVDAAILAQLLRADLLPEAWIAPAKVRQLRALLRHRVGLVRLGTQLRNRIHAVAADFGYDRSASYWTGPGRGWLAELDLPAASREIVTDCLAVIDGLAPLIDRIDGELRQHARADPRVKVLTTLPGVGEFTALVMLAEIGDITRFGSARKLASWAGLTPTVRGSDLTVRHGHISKQGSAWLRWVLNQAAQTAKRSPEFAAAYSSIAKRRGKKIATIAIARKLLTRAWHLLAEMQATSTNEPPRRP